MPAPRSDIRRLHEILRASSTLRGVQILLGARRMNEEGAPPRIVIAPVEAPIKTSRSIDVIRDADRTFAFHIWGRDFDEVCDLEGRLFQALEAQAATDPTNPNAAGFFWQSLREEWNVTIDSAKQGEELTVLILVVQGINRAAGTFGEIDAVALSRTTELTASIGTSDTTINVVSTYEVPTSGVLVIDGEQLSYSGTTATSFTGVTRGIKGTVAATHAAGSVVSVTQS